MYPQRPLAYAPTPYSYTPNPALATSINLDEVPTCLNPNYRITLTPLGSQASLYLDGA